MIRFAWARLMFRAMGLLFVGLAAPACFQFLGQLVAYAGSATIRGSWNDGWQLFWTLSWGAGGLLQLGLGLYLLLGGQRLIAACMRDVDRLCPRCSYDCGEGRLTTCPECGLTLRAAQIVPEAGAQAET